MAWRPNLLIILPHGLRSDALSDERHWPLRTPNFVRLAQRGVRLVASSACPADPGGMVSLLTGLHARQHGVARGDSPTPTLGAAALPAWLSEAGYHVAGVGCVGLIEQLLADRVATADVTTIDPRDCSYWQEMEAKGFAGAMGEQRKQRHRTGPFEPDRIVLEPDEDIDGFIGAKARDMLERMPTDRPWALVVMFSGPGNELPPPHIYSQLIDTAALRDGFLPADLKKLDAMAEPAWPRVMIQRLEPATIARIRADYLGRVSLVDHGVGRLSKALAARNDAEHTWTLVASDRGQLLGELGYVGRHSFHGGSLETPMIIAPPPSNPPKEKAYDGLVSTIDLAPTIAALAGCDLPPEAPGRSLLPIFNGDPIVPDLKGGLIAEFNDRLMLETERYKVVFNRVTADCLGIYDMLNDSGEKQNLIDSAVGRNVLDMLRWRLADALMPLRAAAL